MIEIDIEQINKAYENLNPLKERACYNIKISDVKKEIAEKYFSNKNDSDEMYILLTYLELGLIDEDVFKNEIKERFQLDEISLEKILAEVKERITDAISKEIFKIQGFETLYDEIKKENEENVVPLPPYKEIAEEKKLDNKTENVDIYKNTGIEFINEKKEIEPEIPENISDNIFGDSGINLIEEKNINDINITENEKRMLDEIEHPENISNSILGDKLSEKTISKTKTTDYSLPKINDKSQL